MYVSDFFSVFEKEPVAVELGEICEILVNLYKKKKRKKTCSS